MTRDVCFILGSGRSLLDLSRPERQALAAHPRTLAMNKYLLFHEAVGILPRAVFLHDSCYPAQFVFFESLRIARSLPARPHFYVNQYYTKLFSFRPRRYLWSRRERKHVLAEHNYRIPRFLRYRPVTPFISRSKSSRPFFWANDLSDELFFYRGSLTTAINLCNILYPTADICLLGVDLNSHRSFYDEHQHRYAEVFGTVDDKGREKQQMAQSAGMHLTALPYMGVPGVQAVLPRVVQELESRGVKLLCGSRESRLVTEGICDYVSVAQCLGLPSEAANTLRTLSNI